MEKNCRKGRFCPSKLKGKTCYRTWCWLWSSWICVLLSGMALLGCDVVSTDQVEVLSLVMRNVERNTSRITQSNLDSAVAHWLAIEGVQLKQKADILMYFYSSKRLTEVSKDYERNSSSSDNYSWTWDLSILLPRGTRFGEMYKGLHGSKEIDSVGKMITREISMTLSQVIPMWYRCQIDVQTVNGMLSWLVS